MREKLEDLIPWVAKLEKTLMKSDAKDPDEVERRTQLEKFASFLFHLPHTKPILCRAMSDIGKRSEMLLAKGRRTQFLDKEQNAQAVVRLADQLQKAILIYQVRHTGTAMFNHS